MSHIKLLERNENYISILILLLHCQCTFHVFLQVLSQQLPAIYSSKSALILHTPILAVLKIQILKLLNFPRDSQALKWDVLIDTLYL